MSDNEITFMLNALTLIAVPCILFMLHIYFKEDEKDKIAKCLLILAGIFFAPDVIFILLKTISAFIYMLTIYFK